MKTLFNVVALSLVAVSLSFGAVSTGPNTGGGGTSGDFTGSFTGNGGGLTNLFFAPTNTLPTFTALPIGSWVSFTNHLLLTGFTGQDYTKKSVGEIQIVGITRMTNPASWTPYVSDHLTDRFITNGGVSWVITIWQTNIVVYSP